MGFFQFIGRHVAAAILAVAAIILAALGYADQARDIFTGAEPWQLQALGATLFVGSVIMILYRMDQEHQGRAPTATKSQSPRSIEPNPSSNPSPSTVMPPKRTLTPPAKPQATLKRPHDGKVFVADSITPQYLMSFFDDHTTVQAHAATKLYIGKWMKITGPVTNVRPFQERVSVSIRSERSAADVIIMYFKDDIEALKTLRKGDMITAVGEIESIEPGIFTLEHCYLLD